MKKQFLITGLVCLLFTLTFAQPKKKPAASGGSSYGTSGGGNKKPTTSAPATSSYGGGAKPAGGKPTTGGAATSSYGQPAGGGASSSYGSQPAASSQPRKSNVPYTFKANSSGGGLGDSVKKSMRNDNVIEKQLQKERTPMAYDNIREDDAIYRQKLWLEVNTKEKINQAFGYSADDDNGNQRFINILFKAIKEDSVVAFNADDDRFTTPYTLKQVLEKVLGGNDTIPQYDLKSGEVNGYEVRPKAVQADSITTFRIKEEVVFDKEASRLYRRILGIAPMLPRYSSTGDKLGEELMFWIYYPDVRKSLAKFEVYNAKNSGARQTWEDYLESHMFSYYILKSTVNNVKNQYLSEYIKDPLFRLLEGEKIKEKIFNYEQGLWAY
jgi:gliding motility associated protien GldN